MVNNITTLQLQQNYAEKWMNCLSTTTGGLKLSIRLPDAKKLTVVCQAKVKFE